VPRGRALGITSFLPEKDRRNVTKEWLIGQLAMSYGGRVAEELVFGPDKVTTGAFSDIRQATVMARRMVTQFGMSDVVGPIAVDQEDAEVFLGREVVQRRGVSERTAELVDNEIRRLLGEAFERARGILVEHRDALDKLAAALLERETLDREQVELVVAGKALPPQVVPDPPRAPEPPTAGPGKEAAKPARGPVLGNPPPEPAGA
jgi:cell division protease FtsH